MFRKYLKGGWPYTGVVYKRGEFKPSAHYAFVMGYHEYHKTWTPIIAMSSGARQSCRSTKIVAVNEQIKIK